MSPQTSLLLSSCLLLSIGAAGCDAREQVGVYEVVMRTAPGSEPEFTSGSCITLSNDDDGEGGGTAGSDGDGGGDGEEGPEFSQLFTVSGDQVHYRYFVWPEGADERELAAEIEADMDFFSSGETKHVSFETDTNVLYDVYVWGEPDCSGPLEPPASDS